MKHFLFLFLIVFLSCSTLRLNKIDTQNMTVSKQDGTLKFGVVDEEVSVDPVDTLIYHWYKSYDIIETEGGYNRRLLHGPYTSLYLNKNLREQGSFYKGVKDGKWKTWYQNGELKSVKSYRDGILHGIFKEYNKEGQLKYAANYKKGRLHGEEIHYEGGEEVKREEYHKGEIVIPGDKKKWYWPFGRDQKKEEEEPGNPEQESGISGK